MNPSIPVSFPSSAFLQAAIGSRLDLCAAPSEVADLQGAASSLDSPVSGASITTQGLPPAARHPGGRPSTCTEENVELICEGVARGLSETAAAALIGVPASTLSRWRNDHPEILDSFAAAHEQYRGLLLDRLHNAKTRDGRDDWRAAAWLLERSFPEDYGRRRLSAPPSRDATFAQPASDWEESEAPAQEFPRQSRFAAFVADRKRRDAELAALEAMEAVPSDVAPQNLTPEAPTSKTSETPIGTLTPHVKAPEAQTSETQFATPNAPEARSSETSETSDCNYEHPTEVKADLPESSDAKSGLSRRERRRRAHLQRKALAAELRRSAQSAFLQTA